MVNIEMNDSVSDMDNILQGLHILVVDDDAQIASVMAEIFELHGARTSVFYHSPDALTAFEANPEIIDVVYTDETMPYLTGLDMSIAMLKIKPQLPIIITTGYSERINHDIIRKHGIAGFVLKPADIYKLLNMIVEVSSKSHETIME